MTSARSGILGQGLPAPRFRDSGIESNSILLQLEAPPEVVVGTYARWINRSIRSQQTALCDCVTPLAFINLSLPQHVHRFVSGNRRPAK
jgi:hypothetical protein